MKLLLTSAGIKNPSIHAALLRLLGKPIAECDALLVTTVALGVVGFAIFPHLDYPGFDGNTMACAEQWAARLHCPGYAIDDQTAIQVVDGRAEVVSEGQWRYFAR